MAYWTEVFGTSNRLVYMLGYPSLGDRERSWAAFQADPDWQRARAESERNGTLVAKTYTRILRPTAYSPKGEVLIASRSDSPVSGREADPHNLAHFLSTKSFDNAFAHLKREEGRGCVKGVRYGRTS